MVPGPRPTICEIIRRSDSRRRPFVKFVMRVTFGESRRSRPTAAPQKLTGAAGIAGHMTVVQFSQSGFALGRVEPAPIDLIAVV
jgi:hypothetical protein